uniref:Uncharacterized protein n=1 Tax=Oryza punctata TaxID=4537 RepID=A0A0E0MDM9_ORYPU
MLHLRKHLLPLLRVASHLPTSAASSSSSSLHLSRRCLLSTAATAATANPFSVVDYLVAACGLTGGQALKASKKLSHLKSPTKPDAVLAVISGVGLSRADLAAVVAADPMLLCARAHNVAHRLHSLRDRVGLSDADIARFLLAGGANGLRRCDIAPRLEFWIGFVGSFDKLLSALKGNNGFLMSDLDRVVKPNIALLQECGLSVCEIAKLSRLKWTVLSLSPERVKASVLCVEKLVVPRSSDRFKHVLKSACWISEDMLAMKMEFLRTTLGCSEDKLRAAVCMSPQILYLSNKNLCQKIDFLISEVSLEREFIVERPWVLGYSLEKRMVPRHSVMKILRAMGLMKDAVDFSSSLLYSEKKFVARYIDPYKQAAPMLADSYTAACAGKMRAQRRQACSGGAMLHLRRRLLPLLRAAAAASAHLLTSTSASAASSSSLHLIRLLLSTAVRSAATADSFSVEEYLVAACGLTGGQALKASGKIAHLKSASNPDAVLALLSGVGLSAPTSPPRLQSLRDRVGLSDADIARFLLAGGANAAMAFHKCDIASRLEFWIPFVGSFEMLLKIVRGNYNVLASDLDKVIKPNIALLQECGLTVCDIVKMFVSHSRVLTMNPKRMEACVRRTDELGVQRSSGQFKHVLIYTSHIKEGKAAAKMRFLSSILGCSMDKIRGIVCRMPAILGCSEENIRVTIEFLTSTLGCCREKICVALYRKPTILGLSDENLRRKINFMITEPEDIVKRLWVLSYSLEKHMVPRYSVIKILWAMGRDVDFSMSLGYSEKKFIARCIDPYKKAAPTLADAYAAALAGKNCATVAVASSLTPAASSVLAMSTESTQSSTFSPPWLEKSSTNTTSEFLHPYATVAIKSHVSITLENTHLNYNKWQAIFTSLCGKFV